MSIDHWFTALRSRSFNLTNTALASVGVAAVVLTSWMITTSNPRSELQVRLSDGAVWLPSQALGGVSLLDGGSGSIATSLSVAANNDAFDVVQWGSDALIVNTSDGTVARLDGSSWSITTGRVQFAKPNEAMAVVAGHDVGWLVKSGSVAPLDLESLDQRDPVPVGSTFSDGLVTEDGNLLYASEDPDTPVREFFIDGSPAKDVDDLKGPTALADLGSTDAAVDLDDHSVWLANQGNVCQQLEVPATATLQAGGADDHLFVVADNGSTYLWNPRESGCPTNDDFLQLPTSTYGRPVLTFGWAVVQDIESGEVIVVDFDALSDFKRRSLEGVEAGTAVQLVAENGAVWYNDPQSSRAGLIHRDGSIEPISKYDEESGGGFVAAPLGDEKVDDIAVAGAQTEASNDPQEANAQEATADSSTTPTTAPGNTDNGLTPPTTAPDPAGPQTEPSTPVTDPNAKPDPAITSPVTQILEPDPATTTTTENSAPLAIQIGASGKQVVAGGSLHFSSITVKGKPNFWVLQVSPDSGKQATFQTFGEFDYTFYDPGTYTVAIRACDVDNNCVTPAISVTVVANPDLIPLEASFTGPADAEVSANVTFRSTSQGDPGTYRWTFPGGTPNFSVAANGTTSWTEPGSKTVTLEITRGSEKSTITRNITILRTAAGPDSPFGLNCTPSSMSTGDTATCSLVGDPDNFWDLAFSSVVPNAAQATRGPSGPASYTVSSAVEGTVTVTLTGRDKVSGNDRTDTFSISIANNVVQVLPTGTVSGPNSVEAGTTRSFSASGSNIASWSWSGQGSPTFSNPNGETTNVRWANPGTYRLDVVLGGAGSATISKTVTVTAPAPTFAFNPTCAPASRPADGVTAATCKLADGNYTEFTGLTYNVSNPSGLTLNRWGSPGESYIASSNPGQVTVTVTGTHTATSTPVNGGPFTITFTASGSTTTTAAASPFGMSCTNYSVPANGSEVSWCTLSGDLANFSGLTYTINAPNPGALNAWGDYRGYNVGYSQPGNVSITLSGTDLATGNPVSAVRTVTFVAVATTTTSTTTTTTTAPTTTAPQPTPLTISCTTPNASRQAGCSVTADPSKFSGYNWTASPPDPSQLQWWPAGTSMSFQYDAAGDVGVMLTATDIATGTTVSANRTVSFS